MRSFLRPLDNPPQFASQLVTLEQQPGGRLFMDPVVSSPRNRAFQLRIRAFPYLNRAFSYTTARFQTPVARDSARGTLDFNVSRA